jgi:DNA-directed RNA polymerase specialized sigma24 family protein
MALDEEALSGLLRAELPGVYSLSYRLCGNTRDAETLANAVFLTARQKYPDASLVKITVGEWQKKFGSSKKKTPLTEAKGMDATTRSLNALSNDDKIVLVLRDIEGKTPAEAAELIGVSANAFKSRLSHAREMFRQAMLKPMPGRR